MLVLLLFNIQSIVTNLYLQDEESAPTLTGCTDDDVVG